MTNLALVGDRILGLANEDLVAQIQWNLSVQ